MAAAGANSIEETFKLYASEKKGTEITVKDVTRWCKEAKVLTQNLDMPNIQKAFDKIKSGSRTLTVNELDKLLNELSARYNEDKKVGISQAKIDVTRKLAATKPKPAA